MKRLNVVKNLSQILNFPAFSISVRRVDRVQGSATQQSQFCEKTKNCRCTAAVGNIKAELAVLDVMVFMGYQFIVILSSPSNFHKNNSEIFSLIYVLKR